MEICIVFYPVLLLLLVTVLKEKFFIPYVDLVLDTECMHYINCRLFQQFFRKIQLYHMRHTVQMYKCEQNPVNLETILDCELSTHTHTHCAAIVRRGYQ